MNFTSLVLRSMPTRANNFSNFFTIDESRFDMGALFPSHLNVKVFIRGTANEPASSSVASSAKIT